LAVRTLVIPSSGVHPDHLVRFAQHPEGATRGEESSRIVVGEVVLLKERSFDTGVIAINYAASPGEGPPLVLLHGLMDRWQAFLPIIPWLTTRWRLFAPDMRGHGRSGRAPDGVYRLVDIVADTVAFLEGVVGEPAVLFGDSAGAFPVAEVAARHPGLCRAAIVGDMPFDLQYLTGVVHSSESIAHHAVLRDLAGLPTRTVMPRLAELRPDLDLAARFAVAESLRHLDPRALDCHAEGRFGDLIGDFDGDALLGKTGVPVLLLQADPRCGGLIPDAYVKHALAILPNGSGVRLDGVGHGLGLDAWKVTALLGAVVPFLESL
jgi:pimeloyl-ACP methyl ester carboxylesterase